MMQNVTEFRNHMEIECARLACERATEEDLAELERLALEHRRVWMETDGVEHDVWCRRVADADSGLPRTGGAHVAQPALQLFLRRGA